EWIGGYTYLSAQEISLLKRARPALSRNWRSAVGLGREVTWLALGQAVSLIGVIVGVRIVTTLLSPEAYGELALGLTVATLVSQVALGPASNAAERYFILASQASE